MRFYVAFTLVMCLYGPYCVYNQESFVFYGLMLTISHPVYAFYVTGKKRFYLVTGLVHIFSMRLIYKKLIVQALMELDPFDVASQLISGFTFLGILGLFVHSGVNHWMKSIFSTLSSLQKVKFAAEKQKEFILTLSHELRNPLNSLIGSIQAAKFEELSPKVLDFLHTAEVSGDLLMHMINNILDSGKLETHDLEINETPTKTREILERVWLLCSALLRRRSLKGYQKVSKTLPPQLKVDAYRLTQIILNLVGNAAKFTQKGTISMSVRWLPNRLKVSDDCFEPIPFNKEDEGVFERDEGLLHEEEYDFLQLNQRSFRQREFSFNISSHGARGVLKIAIKDTGIGISQENLSKIFQKFSQVGAEPGQRKLGTGLGLYITKELVQRMKGEIRAYSQEGEGTCFVVCIPCEEVSLTNSTTEISQLEKPIFASSIRALLVDDEIFNINVLSSYFNKLCIANIFKATDGHQAVEIYKKKALEGCQFQLITMDLEMVPMKGKEACKKIRKFEQENNLKQCPIIIISGNCTEGEMKECLDSQGEIRAAHFLKKPVKYEVLKDICQELLLADYS